MLSILIPIYNEDVTLLVKELFKQCCLIDDLEFEIRAYDDQSDSVYKDVNQKISYLPNVIYKELPLNIGRAKIRNLLAFESKGQRLLFLDGDSGILRPNFIIKYLKCNDKIIYGGRIYDPQLPNKKYKLHWIYGHNVESKPIIERQKDPIRSFMSNNFIITKEIFYSNLFDESIKGYGYEDIEFAVRLSSKNIVIKHIDNTILHLKLDDNISFLNKTDSALLNLKSLINSGRIKNTRLNNANNKYGRILRTLIPKKMGPLLKAYLSKNPNLYLFQLYKFIVYTYID